MGIGLRKLLIFGIVIFSVLALSTYSITPAFAPHVDPVVVTPPNPAGIPLNIPAGLKVTCLSDPASSASSTTCPVLEWHGISYWVLSFVDNRLSQRIIAYDSSDTNTIFKDYGEVTGVRYTFSITVNSGAQTVTFRGQDSAGGAALSQTLTYAQLEEAIPPLEPEIEKEILEGPEEIGIYLPGPTVYVYEISYTGPTALVKDTVPAEFEVLNLVSSDGAAIDFQKGKSGKSATKIEWLVPAGTNTLTVAIETRESPGGGHKLTVFKPTSCGPLPINDGATAFEVDINGDQVLVPYTDPITLKVTLHPVVIVGPSNSLEVEAVEGAKPCIEVEEPNS